MNRKDLESVLIKAGFYKIDTKKAAAFLGVSRQTVSRWLREECDSHSHIEKLQAEAERIKNAHTKAN